MVAKLSSLIFNEALASPSPVNKSRKLSPEKREKADNRRAFLSLSAGLI